MIRALRPILAACALAFALTQSAPARAEEPRVLIVVAGPTPLAQKLEAELSAARFPVEYWFGSSGAESAADLRARAVARDARVLLRASDDGSAVDVWTADRDGEVVRFRERVTSAPSADPSVMAIRAHEILRATLIAVPDPVPPPPKSASLVAPDEAARPALPAPDRFALSLGPGVVASPGGVGVVTSAALGFSFLATDHLALDAVATVPILSAHVNGPEGSARVGITTLGAGVSWAFTDRDARERPYFGVGMAVAWMHVDGVATPPFVSNTDDVVRPVPYARAGVDIALTRHVSLAFDALAGVALPDASITFAGRSVATLGAPLFVGASSLRTTW